MIISYIYRRPYDITVTSPILNLGSVTLDTGLSYVSENQIEGILG